MRRLEDKVCLITGSNSGVGEETAVSFVKEGAKVIICARREEPLLATKAKLEELGGEALAVRCDIAKQEDVDHMFEEIEKKFGRLDVLINNAGVLDHDLNPIASYTDDDFERVVSVNEKGTMQVTRRALKMMEEQKAGTIVNVASVAGYTGGGGAVYVATKGAMIALTKHTAMRYAGTDIRANAICPGSIITPMTTSMDLTTVNMDMMTKMEKHADMVSCKPCMPNDVADIILFLASDESRALTGQIIVSDFGADL